MQKPTFDPRLIILFFLLKFLDNLLSDYHFWGTPTRRGMNRRISEDSLEKNSSEFFDC